MGGIIPARAGFTRTAEPVDAEGADHPRSRGVYTGLHAVAVGEEGSSPLARGLQRPTSSRRREEGIIPARAGFTRHPVTVATSLIGSSPLARGLPATRSQ